MLTVHLDTFISYFSLENGGELCFGSVWPFTPLKSWKLWVGVSAWYCGVLIRLPHNTYLLARSSSVLPFLQIHVLAGTCHSSPLTGAQRNTTSGSLSDHCDYRKQHSCNATCKTRRIRPFPSSREVSQWYVGENHWHLVGKNMDAEYSTITGNTIQRSVPHKIPMVTLLRNTNIYRVQALEQVWSMFKVVVSRSS